MTYRHYCARRQETAMSDLDRCTCTTDKQMTCIVHPTESAMKDYIADLKARLAAAEADAERYRAARTQAMSEGQE